ncbi:hypothetical protein [Streptomyces sp. NPDC001594]|uniref:hypothetical protein n=1 Tax=Streptomyces sp. NPDC001594 TaxID=3364590 RepID=UPI00367F5EBE
MSSLRIFLSEEGAEAERLDVLAGRLREDLLQLEVDGVTSVPGGDVPEGARGFGTEAGALLVGLGPSFTIFREVLNAVMDWWKRSPSRPTIRLVMDDDVLEISQASPTQVDRSFELFVNRHSPNGSEP